MLLACNYLYISNKEEFTEVKSSLKLFCFALTLVESNVIPLESHVTRLESMVYRHKLPFLPNFLREEKFNFYNV